MKGKWPESACLAQNENRPRASIEMFSPSELYHENSKLRPGDMSLYSWIAHVNSSRDVRNIISKPHTDYRGASRVDLPTDYPPSPRSVEDVLCGRRSVRHFSGDSMDLSKLAKILYLGDGVTKHWHAPDLTDWDLRTAPSGGGLFPVETYCVAQRVDRLSPGLYLYPPRKHCLLSIAAGSMQDRLIEAVPAQAKAISTACACLVLTGVMQRIKFKYGERGYRFVLLEAGHIAQNMLIAAQAEGIGAVAIGGFMDDAINSLLNVDGVDEAVLYMILLGSVSACDVSTPSAAG